VGRRVGIAVWIIALAATSAFADEPLPPVDSPTPPPAPPPLVPAQPEGSPTYFGTQPPPPPARPIGSDGFSVDRHGLMLLGGFQLIDGDRSTYVVLYIPMALPKAPRLKLGVTGQLQYHRDIVPGDDFVYWAYYLQVTPQYDWRLPIASSKGDFAIATEAGFGVGQLWARWPEAPFMPPGWEHVTGVTIHADAAFQFHAHNGLVASLQPLGFNKPVYVSDPPSPFWTTSTDVVFEMAIAAGYRWR
jgi:hypothetical protein